MKTIVATFFPDGEVQFEVVGFEGLDCIRETQVFEKALGRTKARRLKTHHHHHNQPTATTKLKQKSV